MGLYLAGCFTGGFIVFAVMCMAFFCSGGGDDEDKT